MRASALKGFAKKCAKWASTPISCRVPTSFRESTSPRPERLRWLTGFSGSAGACLVTQDQAILFADGRYTIQARQQVDPAVFTIVHSVEEPLYQWVAKNLLLGSVLSYDPWLITAETAERLRKACEERGATLRAVEPNLVDGLWRDRPAKNDAGGGSSGAVLGADGSREDRRYRRRAGEGQGRCHGADAARFGRLALEHPRP